MEGPDRLPRQFAKPKEFQNAVGSDSYESLGLATKSPGNCFED